MLGKRIGGIARCCWSNLVWRQCDVSATLESGVNLRLKSRSDWDVFVEVFVSGEYDEAIRLALNHAHAADRSPTILDLGANVGLFVLRCLDISKRQSVQPAVRLVAVEGGGDSFRSLERQCRANVFRPGQVALHHGLVGYRTGRAYIYQSSYAC